MALMKDKKLTILTKGLSLVMALSFYSVSAGAVDRDISSLPSLPSLSEANQRIKSLKKSLSTAKGEKRGEIIKKITEIENKVLEKYLSSSASRR